MLLLWAKTLLTLVLIIVPVLFGIRQGKIHKAKLEPGNDQSPIGSVVGAALGLLAFMLAFTFQLTANRLDTRRELLQDEVVSIRTLWLQASLLKDSNAIPVKQLLKEYVDLHIKVMNVKSEEEFTPILTRSRQIHDALWLQAIALSREERSSEIYALFTTSVNEVIGLFNKRVVVVFYSGIPTVIYWIFGFIIIFSMLILGFQFGVSGRNSMLVIFSLALTLAAVIWLILALDNPTLGLIKVNQQQISDLQKEISSPVS